MYVYDKSTAFIHTYGTVLDIVILLDRIGNFSKRVKSWFKISATKICILVFFSAFIINFLYLYVLFPNAYTAKISANETFTVWFSDTRPFYKTSLGNVIFFTMEGFRD